MVIDQSSCYLGFHDVVSLHMTAARLYMISRPSYICVLLEEFHPLLEIPTSLANSSRISYNALYHSGSEFNEGVLVISFRVTY
jgi:hypothetical protein